MRLPGINPVLARELKQRVRRPRVAWIILVYLLLLIGILKFSTDAASRVSQFSCVGPGCPPPQSLFGALGRPMLHMLLFFVLVLVCLIVPALTGSSIVGEKERQTLGPLQVTLLRPLSIVIGKLLASLAFIVLLIIATLPLLSTAFWVGGVSIGEVLKGTLMVLATAVVLACLGLAASSVARGSRQATVLAYAMVFVLTVGTFAVYGLQRFNAAPSGDPPSLAALVPNPFVATANVVSGQPGVGNPFPSPFSPLQSVLAEHAFRTGSPTFLSQGPSFTAPPQPTVWPMSLAVWMLVSVGALWFASRRIKTPARSI